ncbi:Retinol dehydrogenase 13, partial [Choanephora cucurbitarum]
FTEKTILITGASDGIGKETAIGLIKKNPKRLILACRESDKARQAKETIASLSSVTQVQLEWIDLADLASVQMCASRLIKQDILIDVLVNNAGVLTSQKYQTKDGFEMQFGTNYLGHFLLTELLLSHQRIQSDARIIQLSSHAMLFGHLDFDDLQCQHRRYSGWRAYTQSKLANVVYANHLQRIHPNLTTYSVHPGMVRTQFARHSGLFHLLDRLFYPIFYCLSNSPAEGASTSIYLASNDDPATRQGGLYWMNCKPFTMFKNKESQDVSVQEKLYIYSQEAVKDYTLF